MGVETAIAAGSSLIGAGLQYGENRAARKRQQGFSDQVQQQLNTGQDSFLQMLRSDPTALKPFQFDASRAFKDLQAQDTLTTNDQVNQLRSGAGSLGARFGSGFASREALLRSRITAANDARNAGISQSSFNNAITAGMSDFNTRRQNQLGLLQLLQGGVAAGNQFATGPSSPGNLVGQTGGDLASLLTLMKYLDSKNTSNTTPTTLQRPNVVNYLPLGAG